MLVTILQGQNQFITLHCAKTQMTIICRQKLVFHNMIYYKSQIIKDSKTFFFFPMYKNQLCVQKVPITTQLFYLCVICLGFYAVTRILVWNTNRWYLKHTTLTNICTCKHEYHVQMNCKSVAQWVYQNATLLYFICR